MLAALFADRNRARVLPALLLALALLMAALAWVASQDLVGYWSLARDPAAHDGEPIVLSLFEVGEVRGERSYLLEKGTRTIPVQGPTEDLPRSGEITVAGRFRAADLAVVEEWRLIHEHRAAKKRLGLLGLGFLLVAVPLWFRVREGRVELRG